MFSMIRVSAGLGALAWIWAFAPLSVAQAATESAHEQCIAPAGYCDFTPGREGVHRIQLRLPAAQAEKLGELSISGQQCPLTRGKAEDGAVSLSCFAYLSGGMSYRVKVPAETAVTITRADPGNGEPVTLIP
ncbi:hypothetical protein CHU95_20170 [Niveispirillum lacus]|uniref:Uncharacterized protein n=1 Tax=Niveispirillum lacus TaxID=1981099 RepID=A0A255YQI1_9PROT|nr:hypothetical protein [Niveispirillum lacus]OYQ31469.1 hypothetical protein CHU95_20170 [Niveispirillum lacus]